MNQQKENDNNATSFSSNNNEDSLVKEENVYTKSLEYLYKKRKAVDLETRRANIRVREKKLYEINSAIQAMTNEKKKINSIRKNLNQKEKKEYDEFMKQYKTPVWQKYMTKVFGYADPGFYGGTRKRRHVKQNRTRKHK